MESHRFLSFFFLLISASFISSSSAYTFKVGGQDGWVLHPSENYTSWAGRNRFLVNDTLYFKYKKGADYVLQVGKDAYDQCNAHHSWRQMRSGNSFFTFDKSGPFYFISGKKDNCDQGQKLHVVVLSTGHKPPVSPSPAAYPVPSVSPAASHAPVSHVPASTPSPHVAPSTSSPPASHVPASVPSPHVAPAKSPAPMSHVPAPAPSTHVAPATTPAPPSNVPASAPSTHVSPAPSLSSNVPTPSPTSKSPVKSPAPPTHVPSPRSAPSPSTSPASPPESPSSPPATPPSESTPPGSSPSPSEIPSDSPAPAPAPKSAAPPIGQSSIFMSAVVLALSLIYVINVV